jgi:hypothetical protein
MAMVALLLMMRIFGNSFEIKKEINQSSAAKKSHNNILSHTEIVTKKGKENAYTYCKPAKTNDQTNFCISVFIQ